MKLSQFEKAIQSCKTYERNINYIKCSNGKGLTYVVSSNFKKSSNIDDLHITDVEIKLTKERVFSFSCKFEHDDVRVVETDLAKVRMLYLTNSLYYYPDATIEKSNIIKLTKRSWDYVEEEIIKVILMVD